jgi:hypothetical protein
MVIHICKKCGRKFGRKEHLDYHINKRKTPCGSKVLTSTKCEYCEKVFSTKSNLRKHWSRCKKKIKTGKRKTSISEEKCKEHFDKDEDLIWKKKIDEIRDEIRKEYMKELIKIKRKCKPNYIQNYNKHYNKIIVNQIPKLVPHGKEDFDFINKKDYIRIFSHGYKSIPALMKKIHINDNKKEYQNVRVTNIKGNTAQVFTEKLLWETKKCDDIFDDLIDKLGDHLTNKFDEMDASNIKCGEYWEMKKKKFMKFKKVYDNDGKEWINVRSLIIKDIFLDLYNQTKKNIATKNIITKIK